MIYRVGLTGGIGSGKSTVGKRLRQLGIPVLDADQIVRELYRGGGPGAAAVLAEFGAEFLDRTGSVDRARLAARVFGDPAAIARLNARVHPLVLRAQEEWFLSLEAQGEKLGVVEATLLVETGGRRRYHFLIVLSAPAEERLRRALHREPRSDPAELRRRIDAQLPDSEREKVADVVLRSDGEKSVLLAKVDELAERLRAYAEAHARGGVDSLF